jgi:hypothetical protein
MIHHEDIRQVLRTSLIYSFMAHGYTHNVARELAEIAMEPCAQTIDLCQRIIRLNMEAAAITISKAVPP